MAETSRLPQGVLFTGDGVGTAKPVGTVVGVGSLLHMSNDAASASYDVIGGRTVGIGSNVIADPGTAAAIPVTASGFVRLTVGTGVETNTLANPTSQGQVLSIILGVVGGGSRAITAASVINQANNTIMTFAAVDDHITLMGVIGAAGTLQWSILMNDGVALS